MFQTYFAKLNMALLKKTWQAPYIRSTYSMLALSTAIQYCTVLYNAAHHDLRSDIQCVRPRMI